MSTGMTTSPFPSKSLMITSPIFPLRNGFTVGRVKGALGLSPVAATFAEDAAAVDDDDATVAPAGAISPADDANGIDEFVESKAADDSNDSAAAAATVESSGTSASVVTTRFRLPMFTRVAVL